MEIWGESSFPMFTCLCKVNIMFFKSTSCLSLFLTSPLLSFSLPLFSPPLSFSFSPSHFPFLRAPQFPKLCSQFFTLLHYMCQDFSEKVLTLPDKLTISFLELLEMGLRKYTTHANNDIHRMEVFFFFQFHSRYLH